MKEIPLHTADKTSRVLVGESFRNLGRYLPEGRIVVISDENVAGHYGDYFPGGLKIIVKSGIQ